MRGLRTCNARRRRSRDRRIGPALLQAWEAYVDVIEDKTIHLVMQDLTRPETDREYGTFPRRLFKGLDVREGSLLTVEVHRGRGLVIHPTPSIRSGDGVQLADLLQAQSRTGVRAD